MAAQVVDVLVVGAGPAGLTAAATLRRYGVDVLVIERKQEILGLPRATVVSTRSMELFRSWGLEDRIHAGGAQVEWRGLVTDTLADAGAGEAMELGLPSREQAAILSPVVLPAHRRITPRRCCWSTSGRWAATSGSATRSSASTSATTASRP
jgi:2-polyprenyl-6-methoxyphenol hydroxylase-like FAD-dependent oxidoreductase